MLAFLFPITLDGLILAGSLLILYFAVRGKRSGYGFFLTSLGVIASIAGNVVISPNDLTYQILHATSPVVLFLALESLMILLRARSRNAQEAAEKEIADKKLHDDGYFHHKSPELHSKALEPEIKTSSPQELAKPQAVTPKASQPTPVVQAVQSTPQKTEEEPLSSQAIPSIQVSDPEPEKSRGLGKHSNRPDVEIPAVEQTNVGTGVNPAEPEALVPVSNNQDPLDEPQPPSKREIIRDLLLANPEMDAGEIVDIVGGDKKYVQKLIRAERAKITG